MRLWVADDRAMHANLTTLTTQDGRQLEYLVTGRWRTCAPVPYGNAERAEDFSWLTGRGTAYAICLAATRPATAHQAGLDG